MLAGGTLGGQLGIWDEREGGQPRHITKIEHSHRDRVNKVVWINSKGYNEFFTGSGDGRVLWWDVRKFGKPLEILEMDVMNGKSGEPEGVSCIGYEFTIPMKFMVGTDRGNVYF